ncbi:bifunctional tetrahydrofolate synthase/dihydrofolate synthase [Actinobacillus succinogenes]|uniref:Dihydrofolate synthase/folylpolyglutamate synthase n=1 Tax=Actinobacillus succinogenes (strain ATCC 55618 / DSM 22257 / CCUG 43843 / 130Z) TaxID=339671 RepID=A6VP45_ACTSZ|nr:bifunctional tetrahydrofolate synthase/dihydrofolate synthase [Actinobacillus succinogenes]ABR74742.1 FolC bifunctional protein [Actinobacillus succinogenes 130Z]PHI40838.1 bifunctional tetrahydrofolate synthase/dihydrofolate synthase [Actinobacillus succinogenes]
MQHNLKATSSLNEWLSYLENSHFKAIDLGLERIKTVARELNLLRPAPYVITVGGTNGKGTTCRLLETILINAGYKVGVYSSPHLIRYNERVRIQNQELADDRHTSSFAFINEHKNRSLTYFEFSTLSALYLFKQAEVDVAILEVGLGGRLDATNIVDADMAVITSIDIDHVDFLGDTREKIGYEKAGIFRAGKPVIIGEPDCPHSIAEYAKSLKCAVSRRDVDWSFTQQTESWTWQSGKVRLENLPFCQIPLPNAATVLAAVQALPSHISETVIRQSLQEVELIGRFQKIKPAQLSNLAKPANKPVKSLPQMIIDVGHNPHAARYLSEKLTALHARMSGRMIAVCGILKDKDATGILTPLLPVIDEWICVTLTGERGQTGESLNRKLQALDPDIRTNVFHSVQEGVQNAIEKAHENDVVIVFGSFHTVGEFLQLL